MKRISAPASGHKRMTVRCFCPSMVYGMAQAVNPHDGSFEVEDDVFAVIYTAHDSGHTEQETWVRAKDGWVSTETEKGKSLRDEVLNVIPPEPYINPDLMAAAEKYAAEYKERNKVVVKAFKRVTK